MENEEFKDGNLPTIADDFLIQVAEHAERRIDAVMKIKRVALKVTNARDWTDQNGNPYLQVSGSEKVANLFNISWRIEEPLYNEEPDGHFTWTYRGIFQLGGRSIDAIGTRSSKDAFFNKYQYGEEDGKKTKTLLPISAIDKGDVKKAAFTNLLGNGITRILGIRNLTWDDLKEFAGITKEQVTSVQYKKGGEKPPVEMPKEKTNGNPLVFTTKIEQVVIKTGKKLDGKEWTLYTIEGQGEKFTTFSKTQGEFAKEIVGKDVLCDILYTKTDKGNNLTEIMEHKESNNA